MTDVNTENCKNYSSIVQFPADLENSLSYLSSVTWASPSLLVVGRHHHRCQHHYHYHVPTRHNKKMLIFLPGEFDSQKPKFIVRAHVSCSEILVHNPFSSLYLCLSLNILFVSVFVFVPNRICICIQVFRAL